MQMELLAMQDELSETVVGHIRHLFTINESILMRLFWENDNGVLSRSLRNLRC